MPISGRTDGLCQRIGVFRRENIVDMRRLAIAVSTVLPLILLAGCAGSSHPAHRSSATTQPSTTSTTTVPASTTVKTFSPWTVAGTLSPGIQVLRRLSGGSCFALGTNPDVLIADGNNENAWRCTNAQGMIYDPCFAPPEASNVTEVACAATPVSGVAATPISGIDLLDMSKPLLSSSTGFKSSSVQPWILVLSNGDQCEVIQGTASNLGNVFLYYGCTNGTTSDPSTASKPWTVSYLPTGGHALVTVTVTIAWE
jgi:hypothetical protein